MSVEGRTVIVTGAGRRLGRAYAEGLGAAGANVVVADIIDTAPVVDAITTAGGSAIGVPIDVLDPASLDDMLACTVDAFGAPTVLINNAAYFRDAEQGSFVDVPIEQLERCLDVNVKGTWLATRAVVPSMKEAGFGKIINVSSASYFKGKSATGPHYLTSKTAILGFSRALARELGPFNICVNNLVPDAIPDPDAPEGSDQRAIDARCFPRRQRAEDMVGTVLYLCGTGSDFVTGQSFHVNGGSYLT